MMYWFKLLWVSLLGMGLNIGVGHAAEFKPKIVLIPGGAGEYNTQYSSAEPIIVQMHLMGETTLSGFHGLWLEGSISHTAWNWKQYFKSEGALRWNPKGSVGAHYSQHINPQLRLHTYGIYHVSKCYITAPESAWRASRHVNSVGVSGQSLKTGLVANLNAHVLLKNQELTLARQDQWQIDLKVSSPIPFVIENTWIVGGPYYKCIQTQGNQANYWGGSVVMIVPLSYGSGFVKYSYDDYDNGRFLFGWFRGPRSITPLTPENFM